MKKLILLGLLLSYTIMTMAQQGKKIAQTSKNVVDIYHHVPFIPQPTNVSCWSTSLAMILWWCDNEKSQTCLQEALTPQQVATNINYFQQFFGTGGNGGLPVFDNHPLDYYGLVKISTELTSHSINYYIDLIKKGPVWVAYEGCANPAVRCGHAVVWVGMKGDGTETGTKVIIHDPDDGSGKYPNLGVRDREMTLLEFEERLANRAYDRTKNNGNVAHLNFLAYKPCR